MKWGGVVGAALMAIGSLLPWATAGIFSVAGTDGDGIISLIAGVVALAVFLSKRTGTSAALLVFLLAGFGGWVAYLAWQNTGGLLVSDGPRTGTGIYVTLLGAAVAFISGFGLMQPKTEAAPPPPPA